MMNSWLLSLTVVMVLSGVHHVTSQPPSCPTGLSRTVVFMKYQSQYGQHLFYRGGIGYARRPQCYSTPGDCLIPIGYDDLSKIPNTPHYTDYKTWAEGDTVLGWGGAEQGQSIASNGRAAGGTPAVWTTNDQSNAAYHHLNKYGDHYWMVDLCMDCDATESGWFEVKAYIENNANWGSGFWENNVNQWFTCHGNAPGSRSRPYASGNHLGRCGLVNVFTFEQGMCIIDRF